MDRPRSPVWLTGAPSLRLSLHQCSWCRALRFGHLFVRIPGVRLLYLWRWRVAWWTVEGETTQGVCPACSRAVMRRWRRARALAMWRKVEDGIPRVAHG